MNTDQAQQGQSDSELLKIISTELQGCGCDEYSFTLSLSSELYDDEDRQSVLVDIQFRPFSCDDGPVIPAPVSLQFDLDKAENEWQLIVGEDSERAITGENLFAQLYFHSLHPATQNDSASTEDRTKGCTCDGSGIVTEWTSDGPIYGPCAAAIHNKPAPDDSASAGEDEFRFDDWLNENCSPLSPSDEEGDRVYSESSVLELIALLQSPATPGEA